MKTFSQHLSEQPETNKLDKLTHVTKLSSKRLKQLARPYPVFQHLNLEDWMGYYPPSNSSEKTKKEIQYITSLGEFRTQWEDDMIMSDLKIMKAFQVYLDEYGLEVNTIDRIKEYKEQSEPIILVLKRHYNRPRPVALAKELGLPLDTFPLKTANTPSYPSGHATQGRLVALLLADEVPLEHRNNILKIGDRIAEGRQVAGSHYPSDTEFGYRLADELYRMAKSSMEPDLTLESILKEEDIELSVADYLPKSATHRTAVYEGAAIVGFIGKSVMTKDEWLKGGEGSFNMGDWYNNHYLKKGGSPQAWLEFCKVLGSAKLSGAKDFIWARINKYYDESPKSWQTKAYKNNTADAIIITKGTADQLFSVMKKLNKTDEVEQAKLTKSNSDNLITVEGISFYQVSLKKAMNDSRIGKVGPWFVDRADLGDKGYHKPGQIFDRAALQSEEWITESLYEGFWSDLKDKVLDKAKKFVSKVKKFLGKLAKNLYKRAQVVVDSFIKRDKSVVAATKIVEGLKSSGAVISEGVLQEKTMVLNQPTVDAIQDFKKGFGSGKPFTSQLKGMQTLVRSLNSKKNPTRAKDPILLTGTTFKSLGISSSDLKSLETLYKMKVGDTITLGEGTPFNTVTKLTSNMIGFVYINGLLKSIEKDYNSYENVDSGLSNAIIGLSAEVEGEAKFGNTAIPVVICYGGQKTPTKLGSRKDFESKKKEKLENINQKYNDYPILVIRINKLQPHNSINLFLLNSVDVVQDHADPAWMNVAIATNSGSKFSTKVESNKITKTYEK
tara:strand:- start:449 stop:2794 length:2346 start_codon:yes stop_codon:yes gene_type:complete